ncbi:hydrogenase-2 assembly chaperone [Enterobacter sp.]|uniref:hydrogenase-2 assembly chaperone n=1 Tax=Enterobacter sp. TaxID=42895 RepID=UPI00296FAC65|nr:hydrogenase-2 assembly chaperone [Enterobacter sp.]
MNGFSGDPAAQVQTAFAAIGARTLHDLAFLHPAMPVYAAPFTLFEEQWIGCLITPWMLSALVLPGSHQRWQPRPVGEKLALALPAGNITFTVGELESIGHYLACSLMSPVQRGLTAAQGINLTNACARMLLSLPVNAPDLSRRRALFGWQARARA